MTLDANAQEAAALLDLLDRAVKRDGLNVVVWTAHWALKIKAAQQAATVKAEPKPKLAAVEGADA